LTSFLFVLLFFASFFLKQLYLEYVVCKDADDYKNQLNRVGNKCAVRFCGKVIGAPEKYVQYGEYSIPFAVWLKDAGDKHEARRYGNGGMNVDAANPDVYADKQNCIYSGKR